MERIAVEIIGSEYKTFVFQHSDNLGFYLQMKAVYLEKYVGHLRENEHMYDNQILASETAAKKLAKIAAQSTYLHPRLHSSLPLLIHDIYREQSQSERAKVISLLLNTVVIDYFSSTAVYASLKSNTRPKFLNIGLKLTALLMQTVVKNEKSTEIKELVLAAFAKPEFLRIFIKNYQNAKSPLADACNEIKAQLMLLVNDLSPTKAYNLLMSLFGPNTQTKLALKRN